MSLSRRRVMVRGAVIGAGLVSSTTPLFKALAAGQPPLRRTLEGLAWNDPIVSTYRDAVAQMKLKPASDKASWVSLAAIHGSSPNAYHFCPHGNWYFLPWHRAYTLTYERFIRSLTKNDDFALPFWDWTHNPTMPEVFLTPTTPDGKKNALYVNDQDFGQSWKRTWPPAQPMPPQYVGQPILDDILGSTDYEEFGTSRPRGQNNLDPKWVTTRTGAQGTLERLPHNMVHNSIGGWMPSALSPRDPIFFMHHCNIDRIWAVWNSLGNANSSESLWKDMQFTNNFVNVDGSSYSPKVSDLFVPEDLGYTYGLRPAVSSLTASPNLVTLKSKLTTLFAASAPVNAGGIKTYAAAVTGQPAGTAAQPLAVSLNVDPALVAAVAKRTPVPSGSELLNFALAREQRATGPRVLAFVRDVMVTQPENTEYRVFLNRTDLNPQVPVTDANYVGSFGIFVHGEHGGDHGGQAPSFLLDLTRTVQRVYGSGLPTPGALKLQFLPVPTRPNVRAGTITPGSIEIAFVDSSNAQ
jgi:tyrosinase